MNCDAALLLDDRTELRLQQLEEVTHLCFPILAHCCCPLANGDMGTENSLLLFPYTRRRAEGAGNGKEESGDRVLNDSLHIRRASVWLGDLAFKKHI
jgi:hypothetical protein